MQYYAALHRKKEKIWWFTSGFSILGASTHWDRAIGLPLEDGHFDTNALVGTSSRATYPRMIELVRWCQVWMSIHGYGRTSAWTLHIIRLIDHDIVESTKILQTLLLLIYYRLIYHVHYYLTTNVVIVHIYIYTLYINTYVYMYNHTIYHTI